MHAIVFQFSYRVFTGMIACLVLCKMLKLNPERCFAYFVTDKILLALQQSEYIKKEFADGVSGHLKVRPPHILSAVN